MSQRRPPAPYRPPATTRRGPGLGARVLVALVALALVVGGVWLLTRPPAGPAAVASATAATATPTAPGTRDPASGLRWVSVDQLPPEASDTLAAIRKGPPFPIRKDGSVFENREGLLPRRESGYYREFTVVTPGESDRGARRIVTGGPRHGVANGEFYYTRDHYGSFERIRP